MSFPEWRWSQIDICVRDSDKQLNKHYMSILSRNTGFYNVHVNKKKWVITSSYNFIGSSKSSSKSEAITSQFLIF